VTELFNSLGESFAVFGAAWLGYLCGLAAVAFIIDAVANAVRGR